jgi:hypothetical protein
VSIGLRFRPFGYTNRAEDAQSNSGCEIPKQTFTTVGCETFTIHPGDVLLAEDHTGSAHKWRLLNDEPWKHAYVVFKKGADTQFVPDSM